MTHSPNGTLVLRIPLTSIFPFCALPSVEIITCVHGAGLPEKSFRDIDIVILECNNEYSLGLVVSFTRYLLETFIGHQKIAWVMYNDTPRMLKSVPWDFVNTHQITIHFPRPYDIRKTVMDLVEAYNLKRELYFARHSRIPQGPVRR